MFGPKRDANGEWRRPHKEGLHSLYHSPNIIKYRRLRWASHVARKEDGRITYRKDTFGWPWRR